MFFTTPRCLSTIINNYNDDDQVGIIRWRRKSCYVTFVPARDSTPKIAIAKTKLTLEPEKTPNGTRSPTAGRKQTRRGRRCGEQRRGDTRRGGETMLHAATRSIINTWRKKNSVQQHGAGSTMGGGEVKDNQTGVTGYATEKNSMRCFLCVHVNLGC